MHSICPLYFSSLNITSEAVTRDTGSGRGELPLGRAEPARDTAAGRSESALGRHAGTARDTAAGRSEAALGRHAGTTRDLHLVISQACSSCLVVQGTLVCREPPFMGARGTPRARAVHPAQRRGAARAARHWAHNLESPRV